jgi:hypothetical protein
MDETDKTECCPGERERGCLIELAVDDLNRDRTKVNAGEGRSEAQYFKSLVAHANLLQLYTRDSSGVGACSAESIIDLPRAANCGF